MYIPEKFKEERVDVLHQVMRSHPFASLIVTTEDGTILANHIPLETVDSPAPWGGLRGHIARANPLWRKYRQGSEAVAIFQGPQSYISPNYYATKKESGEVVPTWNYAVVHARGTLQFTHDADWLLGMVSRLTEAHEKPQPQPWAVTDAPDEYVRTQLKLIVGVEFTITSLIGKWKLSQNRVLADRQGVKDALSAAGDDNSTEMAGMLSLE